MIFIKTLLHYCRIYAFLFCMVYGMQCKYKHDDRVIYFRTSIIYFLYINNSWTKIYSPCCYLLYSYHYNYCKYFILELYLNQHWNLINSQLISINLIFNYNSFQYFKMNSNQKPLRHLLHHSSISKLYNLKIPRCRVDFILEIQMTN